LSWNKVNIKHSCKLQLYKFFEYLWEDEDPIIQADGLRTIPKVWTSESIDRMSYTSDLMRVQKDYSSRGLRES